MSDAIKAHQCYEYMKNYVVENSIDIEKETHYYGVKANAVRATTNEFGETHVFFRKTIVFTGGLEKMQRQDAMQLVVNLGGICGDTVTQNTNFLVLGNAGYRSSIKDGKSSKHKKAEKLKILGKDIEIISENVFYDMI